jgi:hypothetical protein
MNHQNTAEILPLLGTAMDGGFYAGRIRLDDGTVYALIVAPKAKGEKKTRQWIGGYKDVPGARSYNDGLANTNAMAEAGSKLAKWARDLLIGGHDDWYLPSQEELEIIYRNLKPTNQENYCRSRNGINLSAIEPTRPYTPTFPAQTLAEAFQEGGEQALEAHWHWTSTQYISNTEAAWCQNFNDGYQDYGYTDLQLRARAVRRIEVAQ